MNSPPCTLWVHNNKTVVSTSRYKVQGGPQKRLADGRVLAVASVTNVPDLPLDQRIHRGFVAPVIVPKHVLVNVGLKVLRAHRVVDSTNTVLQERPEAFQRVHMNLTRHVDLRGM